MNEDRGTSHSLDNEPWPWFRFLTKHMPASMAFITPETEKHII